MARHYLLWCTGEDRPGIVATLTKILYEKGCNLEDSSMMRLGREFSIFVILSSKKQLDKSLFAALEKHGLTVGLKPITTRQAKFVPAPRSLSIISVHGPDRPGIVYRVTHCLADHRFNITDLSTHRTGAGKKTGYILFIEGEISPSKEASLKKALRALQSSLKTTITFRGVNSQPL